MRILLISLFDIHVLGLKMILLLMDWRKSQAIL